MTGLTLNWKLKNPDTIDKWSLGHLIGNIFTAIILFGIFFWINKNIFNLHNWIVVFATCILNFGLWFCWEIIEYNWYIWKHQYNFNPFITKWMNKIADSNGISLFDIGFNTLGNCLFILGYFLIFVCF